jgi:hypothetical protein
LPHKYAKAQEAAILPISTQYCQCAPTTTRLSQYLKALLKRFSKLELLKFGDSNAYIKAKFQAFPVCPDG